ncbi:NAD(P)/FAD-dependent oxidoreductase [Leucobacter luti]|uniref:NAD(P)/FAD-dependent oxidoreductase n=1 Tax=Leucobacter luti TaxID=340320 RepID=UPI003D0725EB
MPSTASTGGAGRTGRTRRSVLVVGGGLIGLCAAFSLLRDGHSVTIVERERVGSGAARGNAGEITPLNVLPMAGPAMIPETVRGVTSRTHYLAVSPLALPRLATFGLSFLAHCAPRRVAAGSRGLDQLVRGAFASFDAMRRDGLQLAGGGEGYVYTHPDLARLEAHRAALVARADHLGMARPEPILRGGDVRAADPALANSVAQAYVATTERFLDPGLLVDELRDRLLAEGVTIREGVTAQRLIPGTSEPGPAGFPGVAVRDEAGHQEIIRESRIVVAPGAFAPRLLDASGIRIPNRLRVRPGRGYSFTVETDTMPRLLLGSLAERTVAIPMNGRLRIVGLMDFDGSTDRYEPARARQLARRASRFLRGVDWDAISEEWVGPRPMTPSGLPVISPLPADSRIVVAAGHNMHGLSLGAVTGDVVAALVAGRAPVVAGREIDLRPFAIPR